MRRVAIVGAGQSGLFLGVGLLDAGFSVTLFSNREGAQIANGRVMSSQCMFHPTLELERRHGLELWEEKAPPINGLAYRWATAEAQIHTEFEVSRARPALSIDQRVKVPAWMDVFVERGGDLRIEDVSPAMLEDISEEYELVVVAAGKGDIAGLFPTDEEHSEYTRPQRALSLAYLSGVEPRPAFGANDYNVVDGVGEMFLLPALTTTGPCEILTIEGIIGGPMDCWDGVRDPAEHLALTKDLARRYFPWIYDRIRNAELTDSLGTLAGKVTPRVRKPVAHLANGRHALGMADVVVVNDPITGQGSNNAARCAESYLESILQHGETSFTSDWMQATFNRYWDFARWGTTWTNSMLRPYPEHLGRLLKAAAHDPELALQIANGFSNPPSLFPWWDDPQTADAVLTEAVGSGK
ncbi:FAD-binding oxidoreductase [Arthrobacter sp. CAU 1506]|nr:FAD-binding oxidoreductase [Arthrobacter sp. CAU 1506]